MEISIVIPVLNEAERLGTLLPELNKRTQTDAVREIGGRKGPDPVRYGDWEKNGRCIDF